MSQTPREHRGVVIVQIDGLSYSRLLRAMGERRLPFLRKLLRRKKFRLHRYFSEIPTSTPAFQAGMFYGNNDDIPGFQFYDKATQRRFKMGDSQYAYEVESRYGDSGLLRGGSVLSCIYTGGAESSLFCSSTLLAPRRWKFVLRLWDILMLSFLNIVLLFKIGLLAAVEIALGLYDMLHAVVHGQSGFLRELEIIFIRVGLTIVSRELITLGAVIDVHRGVPLIYVNYLGYDEHAHLRGPDSKFARWTLRGIDACIRRIYVATLFAERSYDLYILSDHGQCACQPFDTLSGQSLAQYVQTQLTDLVVQNYTARDSRAMALLHSAQAMGRLAESMPRLFHAPLRRYSLYLRSQANRLTQPVDVEELLDVAVVSTGSIAFLYWTQIQRPLLYEEIQERHPGLIDQLRRHPAVGMVSVRTAAGAVLVLGPQGQALVEEDSIQLSGILPVHLSLDPHYVLMGIRRLTLFAQSGDVCLWGGNTPEGNVSYTYEFGAHSGWTNEEMSAFVMAPPGVGFDFSRIRYHHQFHDYFQRYTLRQAPAEPVQP